MKGELMTDKEFMESLEKEDKVLKAPTDPIAYIEKPVFEVLNNTNVNGHTEGRNGLTYLSWAWAWAEVKKVYPDAQYEIEKFNGLPYVFDELTGYMVYTKVTIKGITHEMWLPVMDSANKAMKAVPYTYETKYGEKKVEAATMFDINKTLMRCLTKNLAMHGLGLYIYAGEDLPEMDKEKASKGLEDELKSLWDKAGGKEGFEEWLKKNTEKKSLDEMYPELKTALLKKITDKGEKK
jgi:hypothetical protein